MRESAAARVACEPSMASRLRLGSSAGAARCSSVASCARSSEYVAASAGTLAVAWSGLGGDAGTKTSVRVAGRGWQGEGGRARVGSGVGSYLRREERTR